MANPMHNRDKTHCPRGHPYVEDNIVWDKRENGRLGRKCAECHRQLQREHQARWRAKRKADPEWRALQVRRAMAYAAAQPQRERAHQLVAGAIKKGTLVRAEACERCGKRPTLPDRIEASHDSYDKPLEVEWLCRRCHAAKDRKLWPVKQASVLISGTGLAESTR